MLGKTLAIKVLNEGLSTGADYSEIYEDHSSSYSISNENGKIEPFLFSLRQKNTRISAGALLLFVFVVKVEIVVFVSRVSLLVLANGQHNAQAECRLKRISRTIAIKVKQIVKQSHTDAPFCDCTFKLPQHLSHNTDCTSQFPSVALKNMEFFILFHIAKESVHSLFVQCCPDVLKLIRNLTEALWLASPNTHEIVDFRGLLCLYPRLSPRFSLDAP